MKEETKAKLIKFLKNYSVIIPFGLTILPIVIAGIMILAYVRGDPSLANYILQQVGVVDIWTQGLIVLLSSTSTFVIMILLVNLAHYRSWTEWTLPVVIFGLTLLSLITSVAVFVIAIAAFILVYCVHLMRYGKKVHEKKIELDYFAYIIPIMSVIYAAFPTLPHSIITVENGQKEDVIVIARKEDFYIIQDKKNEKIFQLKKSEIINEKLCTTKDDSFWFKPLASTVSNDPARLDKC